MKLYSTACLIYTYITHDVTWLSHDLTLLRSGFRGPSDSMCTSESTRLECGEDGWEEERREMESGERGEDGASGCWYLRLTCHPSHCPLDTGKYVLAFS